MQGNRHQGADAAELLTARLIATVAAACLLLAGCASAVRTDVTVYQRLPADAPSATGTPAPGASTSRQTFKTYAFHKTPEQAKSLEFDQYELMIMQELGPLGFSPAQTGKPADLQVEVSTQTRQVVRTYIDQAYGPPFGYPRFGFYRGRGGFYGDPFFGGPYYPIERRVQLSQHELRVKLFEAKDTQKPIWEGVARAESDVMQLNDAMPYLTQALFKAYPGENGKTVTVDVPITKK